MKRPALFGALAGLSTLLGTLLTEPAAADEDQDLNALLDEPVVTTASSTAETGTSAPATSSIVTAEDLRRYGMHTLAEAVSFLALGVTAQHTLDGDELGARGIEIANDTGNHFLLLIDGHKVNDPYQSADIFGRFSGIPLEVVDHIEVVLGPGSVLYGSNAMLGVINVVTKRGREFEGAHVGVEADVATSIRPWLGYGHRFRLFGAPSELSVEAEYFHADGPGFYFPLQDAGLLPGTKTPITWGGATARDASNADSGALLARLTSGHFDVTLRAQDSDSPVWSTPGDFDSPEAHRVDRTLSIGIKHEATLSPIVRVNTRVYAAHTDHDIVFTATNLDYCPLPTNQTCRLDSRSQSQWAGVEVQPAFDWFRDGRFVTMLGVDATARRILGQADTYADATGQPIVSSEDVVNHEDVVVGAYGQQTWSPARWLGLNAGARLDYDERFPAVVSPRIAANVQPWKGGALKAIYSEAFRAPTFFESYVSNPLVPPPDGLKPEKTRSIEGSIEQKFAAQRLLFGIFHTTMTDVIQLYHFDPLSAAEYAEAHSTLPPLYQVQNLESIESTGLNASFEGTLGDRKLSYGFTLTAAYARVTPSAAGTSSSEASPLSVSPRTFGNARISYAFPGDFPTLSVATNWMSSRYVENYSTYPGRPTAPPLLELRATAIGVVPHVPGLSYRLSANYLTSSETPFTVGPSLGAPSLEQQDTFRVTIGLTYEFAK
jgi:outer membrane receptor for ferrienterochelin and colicins